jgi:hypothetical protein
MIFSSDRNPGAIHESKFFNFDTKITFINVFLTRESLRSCLDGKTCLVVLVYHTDRLFFIFQNNHFKARDF